MSRKSPAAGLTVLLLVGGFASLALAQSSWWRILGGALYSEGTSAQQTSDGGYIVAGYTYAFGAGRADVWLIKTDAQGDTDWARTYGSTDYEKGNSVQQTTDGGYIIAGYVWGYTDESCDVLLIKTDASGDTAWTRKCAPGEGYSVQQTADGGYIVAGRTDCLLLVKTDSQGDTIWTRTYGWFSPSSCAYSVEQTVDGGYIAAGVSNGHACLVRADSLGDTVWTRTYQLLGRDPCYSVQPTSEGGYVMAGRARLSEGGPVHAYLIKSDAQGDTLWTRTYGDSSHHGGRSVRQTADGGYVIAGWAYSADGTNRYVYLVRTDAQGDTLWTRTFGDRFPQEGNSVSLTSDGGYIIAGYTFSFGAGYGDVYLIKTDADGYVGVAEGNPKSQATARKLAATVVRSLPRSTAAFDAMGRRVLRPKPGIYFLRTTAAALPRKVLLVE
jgi:hypothetical protein